MGSRAPDLPLLSLRGSAPRRPSGALPQRPSALLTTHSSCGAHGTPAAVPSRGLRLWLRARDPVLRVLAGLAQEHHCMCRGGCSPCHVPCAVLETESRG